MGELFELGELADQSDDGADIAQLGTAQREGGG
jgi:hypothetical protein